MHTTNENIAITFSEDETLVLFEWLSRFNKGEQTTLLEDQAEQRVLWDLECKLEKVVTVIFASNYDQMLSEARQRIRDNA